MDLKTTLSQKGLVLQSPNATEIITRAKSVNRPIKIFYGETYDEEGNPIDSMKYYFFVAELAESLEELGFKTEPMILVADVAACRNVSESLNNKYIELGEERARFVDKVNKTYGLNLNIIKMSDYLFGAKFQEKLEQIIEICKKNPKLMKKVEKTIPESKIEIERKKEFAYSFDEITTIMDVDIKIGPPREDLYDGIAREIAKKTGREMLISIYLTPTFPLGVNFDYYISYPGIEEHGITAYKAGSKRLQENRIIIGKTTLKKAGELINKSFISKNPELPNPVLDIGIIAEMAKKRLEKDRTPVTLYKEFYSGKINPEELKKKTSQNLEEVILSKF